MPSQTNYVEYESDLETDGLLMCLEALVKVGALPANATLKDAEDYASRLGDRGCDACPARDVCGMA